MGGHLCHDQHQLVQDGGSCRITPGGNNMILGSETYPNRIFGNACTLLMREIMGIELGETSRNLKILDTILHSCELMCCDKC